MSLCWERPASDSTDFPLSLRTKNGARRCQQQENGWRRLLVRKERLHTGSKAWLVIRKAALDRDEYTCAECFDYGNHVDHIDGDPFNNHLSNLQTLCISCHSRKTAKQDGGFGRKPTKVKQGFDANGEPVDPSAPFYHMSLDVSSAVEEAGSRVLLGQGSKRP